MSILRASQLPQQYNAVSILEHNLADRPDKVALLSAERELTFQQVADEVNQLGNALRRLDVRFGESVGILSLDCAEWAIAYFAVMKIGAIAVGMNTLLKPHEHAYVLKDCRARVLIVHRALLPALDPIRDQLTDLKHIIVVGGSQSSSAGDLDYASLVAAESTQLDAFPTHREDFCSLNYSSGSTGEPKGILHAHKDLPITAQLWAVNVLGLRESDRTFATAKLFFTFGTGGHLVSPWRVRPSCLVMAPPPRAATHVRDTIQ